jgi:3-polyprenyl-4-hydroxybenzoate decarboxylase
MGIDATRKWASEGYNRTWPSRIRTTDEAARKALDIWTSVTRK